jgi:peptidyl-dipeptidase A
MKHLRRALYFLFLGALLLSCSKKKDDNSQQNIPVKMKTIERKEDLEKFLDSLEQTYEQACFAMGTANWNSYSKEGEADLDGAKKNFSKIFSDEFARKTIVVWKQKISPNVDLQLARRMEMWYRCFLGGAVYSDSAIALLENSLQKKITDFQFSFEGKPITRAQVNGLLRSEKKAERRKQLWMVTSQLSETIKKDLIQLVMLRNEKAKQLGFPNYYSLSLYLSAIDEEWLLKTLNELEEQTRPLYEKFLKQTRRTTGVKIVGPWDTDFSLREAVTLSDNYFPKDSVFSTIHKLEQAIGFPTDTLPIQEVVKDIPYGGLSLALNVPKDSRFLVNPTVGKQFYATAFHEYGHSIHAVYTQVEIPILKGYEWIPGAQCGAFYEGMAEVHGEFTDNILWLETYTKAKDSEIQNYIAGRWLPALHRLRNLMKNFAIEYEMYKNPESNLDSVEHAMYEKYLLVNLDTLATIAKGKPIPSTFAASIWYTSYPCYYQNYIIAGMIATQVHEALTDKFGGTIISDAAISRWLIDNFYTQGESVEWTEKIREATGKGLETGAYLRKLGAIK